MTDEENGIGRPTTLSMFREIKEDLRVLQATMTEQVTGLAVMAERIRFLEARPIALNKEERKELWDTARNSQRAIEDLQRDGRALRRDINHIQDEPPLFEPKQLRTLYAVLDELEDDHTVTLQKRINKVGYAIGVIGLLSWPVNAFIDLVLKPH